MKVVEEKDQDVRYKKQHHSDADVNLHHELFACHLANNGSCLLDAIQSNLVFLIDALNNVSLSLKVVACFVINIDRGETYLFYVIQLLILIIQLIVSAQ